MNSSQYEYSRALIPLSPAPLPSKYLKETTLDPATRILLRVDIEAQLEADKTFQQLLGKDASQRYEVIMSEANLVEDLDI